jgi:hypothetical protein
VEQLRGNRASGIAMNEVTCYSLVDVLIRPFVAAAQGTGRFRRNSSRWREAKGSDILGTESGPSVVFLVLFEALEVHVKWHVNSVHWFERMYAKVHSVPVPSGREMHCLETMNEPCNLLRKEQMILHVSACRQAGSLGLFGV